MRRVGDWNACGRAAAGRTLIAFKRLTGCEQNRVAACRSGHGRPLRDRARNRACLGGCGGQSRETETIPPVTAGEGATIAAGADALAFRAAEAICSQSTLQELAERYGVRASRNRVKEALAANFPQSKGAALYPTQLLLQAKQRSTAARSSPLGGAFQTSTTFLVRETWGATAASSALP
jgi:hypothetical protein